jgi:glutathione S-transferase
MVEEAESWANGTLQMAARRITLAWAVREPWAAGSATADGRMGYLLYRRAFARRLLIPLIGRLIFAVDRRADRELLGTLPGLLDRVDAWIADGVMGGDQPNAADFMVAPSLALMLYRPDVRPLFEDRPALELVDRLLPEPAVAPGAGSPG